MPEDKADLKPSRARSPRPGEQAGRLLEETAIILRGVRGKNREAYQYIAAQVDWCREKVLENL